MAAARWYLSSSASLLVITLVSLAVVCNGKSAPRCLPLSLRGGSSPTFQQLEQPSTWLGQDPLLEQEERQTVQERVDAWRQQQQQIQHEVQQTDPRFDDKGRVKLLTGVSKGARATLFFVLMWRNVHFYELADQSFHGVVRLIFVVPLIALFVANMAGVVVSITSPSHSANKRLKAILNLDKVIEALLMVYYLLRLTVIPTVSVSREVYIANILHSVIFILQCQAFTRLSWDNVVSSDKAPSPTLSATYANPYPPYDDFIDGGSGTGGAAFSYAPPINNFPSDPQISNYNSNNGEDY